MRTGIIKNFFQHFGSVSPSSKLKITEQISVMLYHHIYRATVQIIKVLSQSFNSIRHYHFRKIVANNHITVMLFGRMVTYPGSPKQFFKPMRFCTVIIAS